MGGGQGCAGDAGSGPQNGAVRTHLTSPVRTSQASGKVAQQRTSSAVGVFDVIFVFALFLSLPGVGERGPLLWTMVTAGAPRRWERHSPW